MCTVEAGWYHAVPGESVLCHVGASLGSLSDAVGVLRGPGPLCGMVTHFYARGRKMGGVPVVEGRVGIPFSGARGTLSVVQRLLRCFGDSVSLTPS
jgi:hypothetical protein